MEQTQSTLRVAVLSETEKVAKGQGVHSAFVDMVNAFKRRSDVEVTVNDATKPADITHIHTVGPSMVMKSRTLKAPIIVSGHIVPDSLRGSLVGANLWLPFFSPYLRWFYNRAKAVVAVSPYAAKELKDFNVKSRVEVIPNGVNREWFKKDEEGGKKKRAELGLKPDDFLVLGSGQVQPRKGISSFVNVAKKMPDVHFVWVGGRPFGKTTEGYGEMTELMESAPENCHFVGQQPYEDMPAWHNGANLFWLPSLQETFGLVITEAASCGVPVLLRDIETYPDLFAPHYAKTKDDDGFVSEIQRFRTDYEYYSKMKNEAGQLAQKYDWNTIAERLVVLYREVLRNVAS